MTIIKQLASQQNTNDEHPNIELAHRLIEDHDLSGIEEIIENLTNKNKKIQQDCIKVAYEIGEVKPDFISQYVLNFVALLQSSNNRMVWGGMTALSTIATLVPELIMPHLDEIVQAMENGSVITTDKGVLTLAKLATVNEANNKKIFPILVNHLETCRTKEVPQHSESSLQAVTDANKDEFIRVLKQREEEFTVPQLRRIRKIYKTLGVVYRPTWHSKR